MDVDAWRDWHILAHGLAHQVVIVLVHQAPFLVSNHLIDADSDAWIIPTSSINNLTVLNDMA